MSELVLAKWLLHSRNLQLPARLLRRRLLQNKLHIRPVLRLDNLNLRKLLPRKNLHEQILIRMHVL